MRSNIQQHSLCKADANIGHRYHLFEKTNRHRLHAPEPVPSHNRHSALAYVRAESSIHGRIRRTLYRSGALAPATPVTGAIGLKPFDPARRKCLDENGQI